ncbi:MAG: DNA polymerase-3 subunit chi [Halieaceae bacterium]|jgi:DNA polymerase-3 subunit chi
MTRVDFYVLTHHEIQQRLLFACKLAEQIVRKGHNIYVHTADESTAKTVDELLWSFNPASFVPHSLVDENRGQPIGIGWGEQPGNHRDVMINLDLEVPAFVGRFERVSEIVVQEPSCRDALRNSYKFYKERGYPLEKHDIR